MPVAFVQLAVLFLLLAIIPFAHDADPDFWWHLRTGHWILQHGIPRHDPFSWTAAGRDWVAHEWLAELIIYVLESSVGYVANQVLWALVPIGALAITYMIGRRQGVARRPLVLLTAVSTLVLAQFVAVRPQEVTWLLLAFFVYLLVRDERRERVPMLLLPPLMAIWVNLHLGFVYGLAAVGLWVLARLVEAVRGGRRDLRGPLLTAGGCLLASLLNPRGPAILWYPLTYLGDRAVLAHVQEWQRPHFATLGGITLFFAILLVVASLLSSGRPRPFLFLLSLGAIGLTLQAARNEPLVALVPPPVCGPAMASRWSWARRTDERTTTMSLPAAVGVLVPVTAALLVVIPTVTGTRLAPEPNDSAYPVAGAGYIRANLPEGRLFNDYNWGGYLIDRLYPQVPVFVDGRTDFYPLNVLKDYFTAMSAAPGWDSLLEQYGVGTVLIRPGAPLAAALRNDGRCQEAFGDQTQIVFVRG